MRLIQGFVTKDTFINNQAGRVNEFFELSPLSLTYSKGRGEYQSSSNQGDVLHTFFSKETTTGVSFVLEAAEVAGILAVVNEVLSFCAGHTGYTSQELISRLTAVFPTQISSYSHGNIFEGDRYTLPDWSTWTMANGDVVRIWHRDEAFQNQYSFYETTIVAPLDNIDQFFGRYSDVSAQMKALTMPLVMERIQDAKGVYPETFTRVMSFRFYNANNPAQYTDTNWGILIYGKNGDNVDSIKDAILNFLLENSTKTEAEWKVIFPEIFIRTEFMLFPRWDKVAIHETNLLGVIYSSIQKPAEMIKHVKDNAPVPLDDAYLNNRLSMIPFDYKAIVCGAIAGTTNNANIDDLVEMFPDYLPVNTSSLDFNRMTVKTRTWVLKMVELIKLAETATEFSTINNPMRRIIRNNKLFVCFVYDNVNFLVSAKKNTII